MMMGVPVVPSELTVHLMNVLQLSGLAYRQSLGPIHPVALMSSGGQKESLWAATEGGALCLVVEMWSGFGKIALSRFVRSRLWGAIKNSSTERIVSVYIGFEEDCTAASIMPLA
jgi:hypothetical protein